MTGEGSQDGNGRETAVGERLTCDSSIAANNADEGLVSSIEDARPGLSSPVSRMVFPQPLHLPGE